MDRAWCVSLLEGAATISDSQSLQYSATQILRFQTRRKLFPFKKRIATLPDSQHILNSLDINFGMIAYSIYDEAVRSGIPDTPVNSQRNRLTEAFEDHKPYLVFRGKIVSITKDALVRT